MKIEDAATEMGRSGIKYSKANDFKITSEREDKREFNWDTVAESEKSVLFAFLNEPSIMEMLLLKQ